MPAPDFGTAGLLPVGVHDEAPEAFLERFCTGGYRSRFHKPMRDVISFATARGAVGIMVGGSFVSNTPEPNDLDCVIVFEREDQIPERSERLDIAGTRLDIFFCSNDRPEIVGSFAALLQRTRTNSPVGVIVISLQYKDGTPIWQDWDMEDETSLEIIKRAYINRHFIDKNDNRKVLVTIHGIMTRGDWNGEIAHVSSSNGWVIAPFNYGHILPTIFLDKKRQDRIVGQFRDHLDHISSLYAPHVSIIAHSFGTYIAAKYILGFDIIPTPIDTLILTGSVLNEDLDLDRFSGKVHKVIHERAPNDSVAKFARVAALARNPLLGRSAEFGFSKKSKLLDERVCDIFDHTNVIRRDVVAKRWLPWLEVNLGRGYEDCLTTMVQKKSAVRS